MNFSVGWDFEEEEDDSRFQIDLGADYDTEEPELAWDEPMSSAEIEDRELIDYCERNIKKKSKKKIGKSVLKKL